MTIKSDDEYKRAARWSFAHKRTATRTTVAAIPFSVFDLAGNPGAGTLAVGNTANGVQHTDATAGYPFFPDAPAGRGWYLGPLDCAGTAAGVRELYDCLFSAGAFSSNASATLSSQPSIEARCKVAPDWAASTTFGAGDLVVNHTSPPKLYLCTVGGTSAGSGGPTGTGTAITDNTCTWSYIGPGVSYTGLELWVEQVTAATGTQTVACGYSTMGDDGVTLTTGRSTGAVAHSAAPIVGRMLRMPLQAGDKNIARLDSITGTVATAGTFNVHLMRKLAGAEISQSPYIDVQGYDRTGLVYVPNGAALRDVQATVSTVSLISGWSALLLMG